MRFLSWGMRNDCVGEPTGSRTLSDFFARHATDRT